MCRMKVTSNLSKCSFFIWFVDFRSGPGKSEILFRTSCFPAGERENRKDTVQSFPAASLATLSPGSRLSR
jgi:hypothetical protein